MRRLSLRSQSILLIAVGLSTIFVVITVYVVRLTTTNLRRQLVTQSESFAVLATKPIGDTFVTYMDSGVLKITQQVNTFTDLDSNVSNVAVVDLNGKVLFQQKPGNIIPVTAEQAATFDKLQVNQNGQLSRVITPYKEDTGAHRYSLVYDISHSTIDHDVRQLAIGIVVLAIIALVLSITIGYVVVSYWFLRPIRKLSTTALLISNGDLDKKIEATRGDEIGDLAQSVNTMADALKADIKKLQEVDAIKSEFMMIASHNLRTPLTVIQGYLEALKADTGLPDNLRQSIDVIAASSSRLSVFAEDILTVSGIETGENITRHRDKTDLAGLLKGIATDFTALAKQKDIQFNLDIPDTPSPVVISQAHVRAAIWNILDNALKFTEKGSISLKLLTKDKQATITVSDTGVGIAPEEIPKLFTKFHRGTNTLEYNYEGTGIGLYLTKLIINQHQGEIHVDSKLGTGTTIAVTLPLTQDVGAEQNQTS